MCSLIEEKEKKEDAERPARIRKKEREKKNVFFRRGGKKEGGRRKILSSFTSLNNAKPREGKEDPSNYTIILPGKGEKKKGREETTPSCLSI